MAAIGPFPASEEPNAAEEADNPNFWTMKETLALLALAALGWAMALSPIILQG